MMTVVILFTLLSKFYEWGKSESLGIMAYCYRSVWSNVGMITGKTELPLWYSVYHKFCMDYPVTEPGSSLVRNW
jgi:hypothetical protein